MVNTRENLKQAEKRVYHIVTATGYQDNWECVALAMSPFLKSKSL